MKLSHENKLVMERFTDSQVNCYYDGFKEYKDLYFVKVGSTIKSPALSNQVQLLKERLQVNVQYTV